MQKGGLQPTLRTGWQIPHDLCAPFCWSAFFFPLPLWHSAMEKAMLGKGKGEEESPSHPGAVFYMHGIGLRRHITRSWKTDLGKRGRHSLNVMFSYLCLKPGNGNNSGRGVVNHEPRSRGLDTHTTLESRFGLTANISFVGLLGNSVQYFLLHPPHLEPNWWCNIWLPYMVEALVQGAF